MATKSLRWEDLHVGLAFESPTRTLTETDVVMFAAMSGDYSELHTSEAFALKTQYGRRVAHGLLVAAGCLWIAIVMWQQANRPVTAKANTHRAAAQSAGRGPAASRRQQPTGPGTNPKRR